MNQKLIKNANGDELERIRANLNHNLLKNSFLNKIGSYRTDLTFNERSTQIMAVWDDLLKKNKISPDIEAIKNSVYSGLHNWQKICQSLDFFFNEVPQSCGYQVTGRFKRARNHIIGKKDSKTSIISKFVSEFDEIAKKRRDEQYRILRKLWRSVDKIQMELSKMRAGIDEDAQFGEYFVKK